MEAISTRRTVGRPRSERARAAILTAALELASELGPDGLTMDAIAKRAAVSKETLYRWWRSRGEVLLEALAELGERAIPTLDTGSLETDLRAFMRASARTVDPATRRILRTLAAQSASDPAFAEKVRERFLARRRAALATVLQHAVDRNELQAAHAATALELVFGSLWYRLVFETAPLDRAWADAVTDAITTLGTNWQQRSRIHDGRRG
jgi:AcrR family transcriptional regulator